MVIAIDGPSGVGKSTVARAVADALGVAYLDTGAYYRAATLIALRAGVAPSDEPGVLRALSAASIGVVDGQLQVDGEDVQGELRGPEVTAAVSRVAAHPEVRRAIVALQQEWVHGQGGSAVVEGRDIGTVVFPDAAVKVFLTAHAGIRARRRAGDAEARDASLTALQADLDRRDRADSSRAVSPLIAADDAVRIDTSDLTVAQVVGRILDLVGAV